MNAVGTLSTTADILQVMGQLQLLLSHRYYRARHALAALTTKHIGEVDALLRVQSGETQTLKERQKDAVRKLLDLHKQVESEMKLEVAQLLAALEAAGCARAGHQHIDADDVSAA